MLKLIVAGSLVVSVSAFPSSSIATTERLLHANNNQSTVCATRPDVVIRDFYTLEIFGQLAEGECMDVITNIQHPNSTIRSQYITVRGGQSGKLRLVSKQFVIYARDKLRPISRISNDDNISVCATRPDVTIKDFHTLEIAGHLNPGECLDVVTNVQHPNSTIRAQYITVRGGSGKLRLVSKKFVIHSNGDKY
jgi:hypothetical protein